MLLSGIKKGTFVDIKKLAAVLPVLILFSCANNTGPQVKEEKYFKNYAFSACLSNLFEGDQYSSDISHALEGYLQRGNMPLYAYEEAATLAKQWRNKKYKTKDGEEVKIPKCLTMYHSDELHELYLKHTPCKSSSKEYWFSQQEFTKSCR